MLPAQVWYDLRQGGPAKVRRPDAELRAKLEAPSSNLKGEIIDGELLLRRAWATRRRVLAVALRLTDRPSWMTIST